MTGHTVGFVFARGGSKGVPQKNLREVGGSSLVARAVETARASRKIDRVVVSTDDEAIAEAARAAGADVPFMRPDELARDDSPEIEAWKHAIRAVSGAPGPAMDVFVCVSPTSPVRRVRDVDRCIEKLEDTDADLVLAVRSADKNPYLNMVEMDGAGRIRRVVEPDETIYRRQDAPEVYEVTTVAYAARPAHVLEADSVYDGDVRAIEVPYEWGHDIDTPLDLEVADRLSDLLDDGAHRTTGGRD